MIDFATLLALSRVATACYDTRGTAQVAAHEKNGAAGLCRRLR